MPPRKQKDLFATLLPSWIPENVFKEYLKMRKSIGKPLSTDYAIELAINKLEELREQGQDITAVLNQSILNSWQGLFTVKQEAPNRSYPAQQTGMEKTMESLQKFLDNEGINETDDFLALPDRIR